MQIIIWSECSYLWKRAKSRIDAKMTKSKEMTVQCSVLKKCHVKQDSNFYNTNEKGTYGSKTLQHACRQLLKGFNCSWTDEFHKLCFTKILHISQKKDSAELKLSQNQI